MIGLTLKHIRYFEALARHEHFGRAAEHCAISQPALSLQIKELEAMMGAPLVERSTRHLRLTPLGTAFLTRARRVLSEVDEMGALVRAAEGPLTGPFRLGIIPTMAPYMLPQIMATLGPLFPGLDLRPRESVTETLLSKLQQAELDVAIVALPVSEPALREFKLFDEDFVLIRARADADLPVPDLARMKEMRLLLLEEGHCFRDQALSFCDLSAAQPSYMMEGSSLSTLVQMVGAGMGVTLVPEMAVTQETQTADVSVSRLAAPAPKRTVGMVWRDSNPLSAKFMEVGSVLRQMHDGHVFRVGKRPEIDTISAP
ncbi:MAG: hydrogen peroxide-inducible genes activator [Pseudomonadota bacterium]